MELSVLLFASYADAFGARSLRVPLARGATVGELVDRLRGLPGGSRLPARPLVAVNRRYSGAETVLGPEDEVALIPPVAGG